MKEQIKMQKITFTVYGEPVAQGRPRFTKSGHCYDPPKSKNYKELVYFSALPHKPKTLITGAIDLTVKIYRSMPKMSKKRTLEALAGRVRPITRPDTDNYVKGIKDALNGVIWKDDSQVVNIHASKWYSDEPRTEIEIRCVEEI